MLRTCEPGYTETQTILRTSDPGNSISEIQHSNTIMVTCDPGSMESCGLRPPHSKSSWLSLLWGERTYFGNMLLKNVHDNPMTEIEVNLEDQYIVLVEKKLSENFEIDPYKKTCLINGYDDIDYLLSKKDLIKAYETQKI